MTPWFLTGDARPRFVESYVITLCSRSRCGAREAMTVGCKPTTLVWAVQSNVTAVRVICQTLPNVVGPCCREAAAFLGARQSNQYDLAVLRGSSLRFPPIEGLRTKPGDPRQYDHEHVRATLSVVRPSFEANRKLIQHYKYNKSIE